MYTIYSATQGICYPKTALQTASSTASVRTYLLAPAGWVGRYGYNLVGYNAGNGVYTTVDAVACAAVCGTLADCVAFVYYPDAVNAGQCFPKTALPVPTASSQTWAFVPLPAAASAAPMLPPTVGYDFGNYGACPRIAYRSQPASR